MLRIELLILRILKEHGTKFIRSVSATGQKIDIVADSPTGLNLRGGEVW